MELVCLLVSIVVEIVSAYIICRWMPFADGRRVETPHSAAKHKARKRREAIDA